MEPSENIALMDCKFRFGKDYNACGPMATHLDICVKGGRWVGRRSIVHALENIRKYHTALKIDISLVSVYFYMLDFKYFTDELTAIPGLKLDKLSIESIGFSNGYYDTGYNSLFNLFAKVNVHGLVLDNICYHGIRMLFGGKTESIGKDPVWPDEDAPLNLAKIEELSIKGDFGMILSTLFENKLVFPHVKSLIVDSHVGKHWTFCQNLHRFPNLECLHYNRSMDGYETKRFLFSIGSLSRIRHLTLWNTLLYGPMDTTGMKSLETITINGIVGEGWYDLAKSLYVSSKRFKKLGVISVRNTRHNWIVNLCRDIDQIRDFSPFQLSVSGTRNQLFEQFLDKHNEQIRRKYILAVACVASKRKDGRFLPYEVIRRLGPFLAESTYPQFNF